MKSVMVLWCFVVGIFVLLGLGFAFMVQQQQVNSAAVRDVLGRVEKADAAIKSHDGSIKVIQSTLSRGATEIQNLNGKIDSLVQQVTEVKAQLGDVAKAKESAAPASMGAPDTVIPAPPTTAPAASDAQAAPSSSSVELGTIPVQK